MKNFWLVKQEPDSYSWADFVKERGTVWTGVRNYTARNNLRKMRKGDQVFYYHSGNPASAKYATKSVVGIARVMREAYPDPTAKGEDWSVVDLAPVKPLKKPVSLADIKANSKLRDIALVRVARLSVQPLSEKEFREILKMAG